MGPDAIRLDRMALRVGTSSRRYFTTGAATGDALDRREGVLPEPHDDDAAHRIAPAVEIGDGVARELVVGAVLDDEKASAQIYTPDRSTVITSPYRRTRSALMLLQSAA